uniref:Origin recognition complex subunit 3 n=1 Tax=Lygus hesperus TaxID=30085 RepID=A0A0A9W290_LYGHE
MESPLDSEDEFDEDEEEDRQIDLKRSQCTLPNLSKWYENLNCKVPSPSKKKRSSLQRSNQRKLVVILKDFETFNPNTLSVFIQILSGYQPKLPFILIFGIATTLSAIDEVLPHSSISRLSLKAFQAQPSVYFLNNTLNKVFLTSNCPFQLSGKLFKFFTQVFLFYDFSVNRFIQGVKYCVMEHYRVGGRSTGLLCCPETVLKGRVDQLEHEDIEEIRRLGSFRSFVESTKDKQKQIKLLSDDTFTKKEILKLMIELRQRIKEFYVALSLLHHIVSQLPQYPLGNS